MAVPLAHVAGVPFEETLASLAPVLSIAFVFALGELRSRRATKHRPR